MLGRTHAASGALAFAVVGPLVLDVDLGTTVAGVVVASAFAYGPDVDHPGSTASRVLFGPLRGRVVPVIAGLLGGHRAGTHSLLSILVVGLPVALFLPWLGLAMGLGWAAHIFGDMLTVAGVQVLWPVSSRELRLARLRTGGWGEKAFSLAQGCALAYALVVAAGVASWSDMSTTIWRLVA